MASREPTEAEVERGITALAPCVREWHLPLNPENLADMAYAVLFHARSEETLAAIHDAVHAQIAESRQRYEQMREAMRQSRDEAGDSPET